MSRTHTLKNNKIDGELTSTSDPVSAAKCLSDTLATNMKLNVKRIAIEYCMIKKGNIEKSTGD